MKNRLSCFPKAAFSFQQYVGKNLFLLIIYLLFLFLCLNKAFPEPYFNLYISNFKIEKQPFKGWEIKEWRPQIASNFNFKWLSYIGGSEDDGFISVKVFKQYIYVGGSTRSSDFPNDSIRKKFKSQSDIIILKFDLNGNLIWGTIIGSNGNDWLYSLAIDSLGYIWGCGEARSSDFTITSDAFQKNYSGGTADAVVFKLDSNGILLYSTYIGGGDYDAITNLAVDKSNNVLGTGRTRSGNFPLTTDAKDKILSEEYKTPIVKFSPNGNLIYSSFFGGSTPNSRTLGDVIGVLKNGNIIVAGYANSLTLPASQNAFQKNNNGAFDGFFVIFDSSFNILYCTYFGGNNNDYVAQIDVDKFDNIYLLIFTNSPNLPLKNPTLMVNFQKDLDAFLAQFDSLGNYIWGSYFGGKNFEARDFGGLNYYGCSIKVTADQQVLSLFYSNSDDLPTNQNNYKKNYDNFILKLKKDKTLSTSTYLGGSADDFSGDLFPIDNETFVICGTTNSPDFPTINALQNRLKGKSDGFVGIISLAIDSLPPTVQSYSDSCGTIRFFECLESDFSSSGIKKVEPVKLDNCRLVVIDSTEKRVKIRISLEDKSQNGFYLVNIVDNAGNITTISDSIFFNSSYLLSFSPSDSLILPRSSFFERKCYDVKISNASSDTLKLGKLYFRRNVHFSIPPSQLPIILPPHDTVTVSICFAPEFELKGMYVDTLEISDTCFSKWLFVKASIDTAKYTAASNCNTLVNGSSVFLNKQPKVQVEYSDLNRLIITFIDFENEKKTIRILDLLGRVIFSRENYESFAELDLNFLSQGFYILRIEFSNNSYSSLPFLK
jgi:hypothetical protein